MKKEGKKVYSKKKPEKKIVNNDEIDKYMIMKIILLFNPIPFTVIFYGMLSIIIAQIKFFTGRFSMSWWFKILPIILGFGVLELLATTVPNIYLSSNKFILYVVLKIIDLIIGYFMVINLEKKNLITLKKV